MSEDVLTSPPSSLSPSSPAAPWPELAALDDFWDTDATPPRGIPCVAANDANDANDADDDDDPTPVNAPRPVFSPTLPPPTTPLVAGPPPVATAELLSSPTGAKLTPPPADARSSTRRPWPRRLGAVAVMAGLVAAGVFGWQWNEDRHDAASAARVLPAEPVPAPDLALVEIEIDRSVAMSLRADLESGDALAVVSGDFSIAHSDEGFWTRESDVEGWTPATAAFLERNAPIVEMIENASILTVTDVFPSAVHPYLRIVDDESIVDPDVRPTGPDALDIDGDVRRLVVHVDRNALRSAEPVLATQLNLAGEGVVDVEIWLDRAGVVRRLSAPADATIVGGEYRLVSADVVGAGPLDQFAPGTFVNAPPSTADPVVDAASSSDD